MAARVLIVDDNETNRKLISTVLASEGFDLLIAQDGEEALEKLAEHHPDIVLLDLRMPKRDGLSVLEAIRADTTTRLLPVVMLTASGDAKDKRDALAAGVTDFVNKPFEASELLARVRALLSLKFYTDELENAHDVLVTLTETIDARDRYTASHSSRVAYYARLLGQRIKMPEEDLRILKEGAFLHDFGKISIRDEVLLKPGKLTEEEFNHIKIHAAEGRRLLYGMKSVAKSLPIIHHHHEKLDGSGYPSGLSDSAISISTRITSIADIFDALTTTRPYRRSFTKQEALNIMAEEVKKGWWDGQLFDEFRGLVEKL